MIRHPFLIIYDISVDLADFRQAYKYTGTVVVTQSPLCVVFLVQLRRNDILPVGERRLLGKIFVRVHMRRAYQEYLECEKRQFDDRRPAPSRSCYRDRYRGRRLYTNSKIA